MSSFFTSKILLFGEYSIVLGSQGLAIPFPKFGGKLRFQSDNEKNARVSNGHLREFYNHLESIPDFHFAEMKRDLDAGLFFDSNIPQGYGAGSSGALCAAIYERYFDKKPFEWSDGNIVNLKVLFGKMEAHFHGASSGGDPLICYLNKPVLMGEDGSFTEVKMPGKLPLAVGLVDTKLPRKTAPLVQHFLEKCEDKNFKTAIENELVIYNEKAIQSFLDGRDDVLDWTRRISKFQFKHFQKMIPASFSSLWENGLATNKYYLKLCGAGGGGFLLAFSSDSVMFQNELTDQAIIPVEF